MSESIIVAVITGMFAFLGVLFSNRKTVGLIEYRLNTIEKKQDELYKLVDRTHVIENRLTAVEERLKI